MMAALHEQGAGFALAFLQASATSVLAGGALLLALMLARRAWPGVASQRHVWLGAMAAATGAFVLALLPAAPEWRLLPSIELASPAVPVASAAVGGVAAALPDAGFGGWDDTSLAPSGTPAPAWLLALACAWLLCYGAGLAVALRRLARARAALRGLLASASRLELRALASHPGFAAARPGAMPAVLETEAAVSPMLAGLLRPVLLLPRALRGFDAHQQQLIIAHELGHWQRRDHLWLGASLLLRTVFWFNPALGALADGLGRAQELGCDRHVLAGRPLAQRREYAAALLAQLNFQQRGALPAAAFGGAGAAALAERILQMRSADLGLSGRLAGAGKAAFGACCAAVLAASVLLQPAFAWRAPLPAASGSTPRADGTPSLPWSGGHAPTVPTAAQAEAGPVELPSGIRGGVALAAAAGSTWAGGPVTPVAAAGASLPPLPVWLPPLARVHVTSAYGPRPRPTATAAPFHHGVDMAARRGTPLLAPADGIVAESTDLYQGQAKYGKVIVIDHGGGWRSMYAHLDQRAVAVGDTVLTGQTIGNTGNTGKTTGPHLHFEIQHGGRSVDPQRLIAAFGP